MEGKKFRGKKANEGPADNDDYLLGPSPIHPPTIESPVAERPPYPFSASPSPSSTPSDIPSSLPSVSSSDIRSIISKVALQGGKEFDDPDSYQSQALTFLESVLSPQGEMEYLRYYALACIYTASFAVENKYTRVLFPDNELLGWTASGLWMTDSDYCNWYGIKCENKRIATIDLGDNNLLGIFAPEVQFLAESLKEVNLGGNALLVSEGDEGNDWMSMMVNMEYLYFGSTSFEYEGVPTFINNMRGLSK